eukprot:TRINITY_DN5332_c0_g3_i1.p1 TRINITY_DN5332_c0_g3~~TRINITY_DN5332_c0_g3_i1.p1  ORF type:complete len:1669 (-),score=414.89 TRINITY_DN5332_c0_g3_i1:6-5012(-)
MVTTTALSSRTQQFAALSRKHIRQKMRRPCTLFLEIFIPILFVIIFTLLARRGFKRKEIDPKIYDQLAVPPVSSFLAFNRELLYTPQTSQANEIMSRIEYQALYLPPNITQVANFLEGELSADDAQLTNLFLELQWQQWSVNQSLLTSLFRGFDTEKELVDYTLKNTEKVWAAVVFESLESTTIAYTLRVNGSNIPSTSEDLEPFAVWGRPNDSGKQYLGSGVTSLQTSIDWALLSLSLPQNTTQSLDVLLHLVQQTFVNQYPSIGYLRDIFADVSRYNAALFLTLAFEVIFVQLVSKIVSEKEGKMKEAMRIMGLLDSSYWLSWFAVYALITLVCVTGMTIAASEGLYQYSNPAIIFAFFLLFAWSFIALALFMTVFFTRAKVAAGVAFVVSIGMTAVNFSLDLGTSPTTARLMCLLPPGGLSVGARVLADFESSQSGIQNDTINSTKSLVPFSHVLLIMWADIFIYLFLTWYVDNVYPGEFGRPKGFLFFLSPTYWSFLNRTTPAQVDVEKGVELTSLQKDEEPVSGELAKKNSLTVQRIVKEFPRTDDSGLIKFLRRVFKMKTNEAAEPFRAVDGLSLSVFEGQILSLLGHNGAGKSTLINILTGMVEQTSGDARVYGKSLAEDITEIRKLIGYCPQQNVIWNDLSVYDHLYLFASIKGVPTGEIEGRSTELLKLLGLSEKRHALANTLSGGMKRKLCLGMAFIGNPRLVFLDEPTSGLDPLSRHMVWDFLRKMKEERTIILTTHFMDEADVLGDRIAIMSKGKLRCAGTPSFLKNRFGIGYRLISATPPTRNHDDVIRALSQSVSSHIQGSELLSNVGREAIFLLPLDQTPHFPALFQDLEQAQSDLGISFAVSVTTLEEVFLRIADEDGNQGYQNGVGEKPEPEAKSLKTTAMIREMNNSTKKSFFSQFNALFWKRIKVSLRDKRAITQLMLYPLALIFLVCAIVGSGSSGRNTEVFDVAFGRPPLSTFVPYTAASAPFGDAVYGNPKEAVGVTYDDLNDFLMRKDLARPSHLAYNIDAWSENDLGEFSYTAFFNTTAYHSLPIAMNNIASNLLSFFGNKTISLKINPLPEPQLIGADYANGGSLGLFVGIAFSLIPGSLVVAVVREREIKSKYQQRVAGAGPIAFWGAQYLADFLIYLCVPVVTLLIFGMFSINALTDHAASLFVGFLFYGLSVFPLTYCISFFFTNPTNCQKYCNTVYAAVGTSFVIIISAVSSLGKREAAEGLQYIFSFLPSYCVSNILYQTYTDHISRTVFGAHHTIPFQWSNSGRCLFFMGFEAVLFSVLVICLEYDLHNRLRAKFLNKTIPPPRAQSPEPASASSSHHKFNRLDVLQEEQRVQSLTAPEMITASHVRKEYVKEDGEVHVAVHDLSFSVPAGECFGLLGPNGAGKSTSLSMLSAEMPATSGTITLNGIPIENKQAVYDVIGLCPQFDPILELLTPREHLRLFATLLGHSAQNIEMIVEHLLDDVNLNAHQHTLAHALSGGNKRKLSLALALINAPPILFLDEPSTGMDPVARRFLWDVITRTQSDTRTAIILTTHSMEECEALCGRIGIIVNGNLMALGSSSHLKMLYGDGYFIDLNCAEDKMDEVQAWMKSMFPSLNIAEAQYGRMKFQVPTHELSLGKMFATLESNKRQLSIRDYSVSQATLEQVFVSVAKMQESQ